MFGNCFRFAELYWKNEVSTIEQKVEAHQLLLLEHDKMIILVSTPSSTHPLDWSGRREGSARVLKQGKLRRL